MRPNTDFRLLTCWLLAWAAIGSTARAQFGPTTPLPGDMAILPSAGNQEAPHIAAGPGHFLAVWEDDASSLVSTVFGQQAVGSSVPGNADVHAMLLDASGARMFDAPIVVAHEAWDQVRPRAAWNGSEYLVVFQATRPTSAFYSDGIYGVRVSGSGQVLDPVPFLIFDSPGFDERQPVVASLGGTWLVAWQDQDPITQQATIAGRVVTGPGVLAPKRTLVPGVAGSLPSELELAAGGGRYALVWGVNFGAGMRARLFDAAALATTGTVTLNATGGRPGLGASGNGFYAAWLGNNEFRGTTIDLNGNVGVPSGTLLVPAGLANNSSVSVCFDGTAYTVAFDSIPNIHALQVGVTGNILTPVAVVSTTPGWMDDIAIAGQNGVTQLLWTDDRATPNNFGIDRGDIWRASLTPGGVVTPSEALSVSPPAQFDARIAGDPASGFVLVFQSWSAGISRIMAQRVNAEGQALGNAPFEIYSADRTLIGVDVAFNGVEYIATWGHVRSSSFGGTPPDVECRRFLADGTLLDPLPVHVMEGDITSVDAIGRTFLIVAHYHHPSLQTNHIIRHRRLDGATGNFLDPLPVFVIGGQSHDVVALADRWLVVWGGLAGVFVDQGGVPGPSTYYGFGSSFRLARNAARTEALIAYEWREASGVHTTTNVRMQRILADGTQLDPQLGPYVSSAANAQLRPVGVALGDEYTFVWADHRAHPLIEPGQGDIYACRMDQNAVQLDPTGIPVLASPNAEGSVELFASGGGRAIFAASAIQRGGVHSGVHRIRTGRYRGVTLSTQVCSQPTPNSSGGFGDLSVFGSTRVVDRDLWLEASALPPNVLALFLASRTAGGTTVPIGSQGTLCLTGNLGRYGGPGQVRLVDASGVVSLAVDPHLTPTPSGPMAILAGESWHFQAWHRDLAAGQSTSNFSAAVRVTFR